MILSKSQQKRFWSEWGAIKRALKSQGNTDAQIENERYALLDRAGFQSLTEVDAATGFDRVLAELAAINKPSDLEAQLRQQQMPRIRLLHAIASHDYAFRNQSGASEPNNLSPYTQAILRNKFGHSDLDRLSIEQLTQLRNTLVARAARKRKTEVAVDQPF